ncbi:MAG: hypothetical protein Tsb0021_14820 [Chlamydiales bacterium]
MVERKQYSYWRSVGEQYLYHPLGMIALTIFLGYCLVAIYAPFLASSKPLMVVYQGEWYFPLFRYVFFPGFFTKPIDLFFNILMFTFPLFALLFWTKRPFLSFFILLGLQCVAFAIVMIKPPQDPAGDFSLAVKRREKALQGNLSWQFVVKHSSPYENLNRIIDYKVAQQQHRRILKEIPEGYQGLVPTLWGQEQAHLKTKAETLQSPEKSAELHDLKERQIWLEAQSNEITFMLMPLIRPYHWEDDAGGNQALNRLLPWWELTRTNRKDLVAALIFGTRVSLVVGMLSVGIALGIGIILGAVSGYFGGKCDIILSRLLEIWESMPVFFILLLVIAMLQSKSIFLVISVIGLFGWTSFARFTRGEFLKHRSLSYTESCKALGFPHSRIIFGHILPNAIPPILTLLPFSMMGAITAEAGLSFLGLGEEGTCSWGVLMDEGRTAFPGESYLLWPPAIVLTVLLIAIALIGDSLRDSVDPKLHILNEN